MKKSRPIAILSTNLLESKKEKKKKQAKQKGKWLYPAFLQALLLIPRIANSLSVLLLLLLLLLMLLLLLLLSYPQDTAKDSSKNAAGLAKKGMLAVPSFVLFLMHTQQS